VDDALFRLNGAVRDDPRVRSWFDVLDPLRLMVRPWFVRMQACGDDVRELFHDHCPVACVDDAPFAYVNAYKAHAAIGFFQGAALPDPRHLLEGTGKRMRHVKLRPGMAVDEAALQALVDAAYADIRRRQT